MAFFSELHFMAINVSLLFSFINEYNGSSAKSYLLFVSNTKKKQ